jgi:hypothetical protein
MCQCYNQRRTRGSFSGMASDCMELDGMFHELGLERNQLEAEFESCEKQISALQSMQSPLTGVCFGDDIRVG